MATLAKVVALWQSWPGAPGYSVFYANNLNPALAPYQSFFETIKALIPSGTTISIQGTGVLIDDASGAITGTYSQTPPTSTLCTGVGNYPGAAGAVCHWLTNGIVNGRRLRGRTFIVPLLSSAFDSNGSIGGTQLTTLTNAAATLAGASTANFRVWHRPVGGLGGSSADVVSSSVPDLCVTTRSRRS